MAELFEKIAEEIDPVLAARWLRRELMRVVHYNKIKLEQLKIDEGHMINLLRLLEKRKITDNTAKKLIEKLVEEPFDVEEYVPAAFKLGRLLRLNNHRDMPA